MSKPRSNDDDCDYCCNCCNNCCVGKDVACCECGPCQCCIYNESCGPVFGLKSPFGCEGADNCCGCTAWNDCCENLACIMFCCPCLILAGTLTDSTKCALDDDCQKGCGLVTLVILAIFTLPITLVVLTVETTLLDGGSCDYGYLRIWAYVVAGVFMINAFAVFRFWVATQLSKERSQKALFKERCRLAGTNSNVTESSESSESITVSLRQTTEHGYTAYPVSDDLCLLPIDTCVCYHDDPERKIGSSSSRDEDLDCAPTANCCFFFTNPLLQVSLFVWGLYLLHAETVQTPIISGNHTTVTSLTRYECLRGWNNDASSSVAISFVSVVIASLVFGWIILLIQCFGCFVPLMINDMKTGQNEFQRSRLRKQLRLQQNGFQNGRSDLEAGRVVVEVAALAPAVPIMERQNESDVNLVNSNMQNDNNNNNNNNNADVESCRVQLHSLIKTVHLNGKYGIRSERRQDGRYLIHFDNNDHPSTWIKLENMTIVLDNNMSNNIPSMGEVKEEDERKERKERKERQERKESSMNSTTTEVIEEEESSGVVYVAKGVGRGALMAGRGLWKIAAWGASTVFVTGEGEGNEGIKDDDEGKEKKDEIEEEKRMKKKERRQTRRLKRQASSADRRK